MIFGLSFRCVHQAHCHQQQKDSHVYYTYRLVECVRVCSAVKQTTLLNLGSHFDIAQADWALPANRSEALLHGQADLQLQPVAQDVEAMAQRCAAQLIARMPAPDAASSSSTPRY